MRCTDPWLRMLAPAGYGIVLATSLALTGCAGTPLFRADPGTDTGSRDTSDRQATADTPDSALLGAIRDSRPGERFEFQGKTIVTGTPYHAASGNRCRQVSIDYGNGQGNLTRLACNDGRRDFFATLVFTGYQALPQTP